MVLEKEQMIASTIARYPKGKLVMAEPYDTREPVAPAGVRLVEGAADPDLAGADRARRPADQPRRVGRDGRARARRRVRDPHRRSRRYRAQRVVLSIGTRGKPRTLQVPGENLPKVFSLLEDPDEWRGKSGARRRRR